MKRIHIPLFKNPLKKVHFPQYARDFIKKTSRNTIKRKTEKMNNSV